MQQLRRSDLTDKSYFISNIDYKILMVTIIHRFQASRWGGTERKDEIGRSPFSADPKPLAHWRGFCWFLINGPNCRNSRMRPYQLCGLSQYNFTTIRVQQYCMYTCKYTTIYSIFFPGRINYICMYMCQSAMHWISQWMDWKQPPLVLFPSPRPAQHPPHNFRPLSLINI